MYFYLQMEYYSMLISQKQGKPGKKNAQWLEECKEPQYQHSQSYIVTPPQESTIQGIVKMNSWFH